MNSNPSLYQGSIIIKGLLYNPSKSLFDSVNKLKKVNNNDQNNYYNVHIINNKNRHYFFLFIILII